MSTKKIIAVCGATGTQGGGVVRDLLADGTFAIRALTRNPEGASAQGKHPCAAVNPGCLSDCMGDIALKKQGVEVVKADLEDTASLTEAFKGAYGVFGITGMSSCLIPSIPQRSISSTMTINLSIHYYARL